MGINPGYYALALLIVSIILLLVGIYYGGSLDTADSTTFKRKEGLIIGGSMGLVLLFLGLIVYR